MEAADTIPKLFQQQYKKYGDKKIAVVQKDLGIWQAYTWKEQYETVKKPLPGSGDSGHGAGG